MSKWMIITIAMIVVTIGIIFGALVYLLKKNEAEEDDADEQFLKSKVALLNKSVEEQLKSGIVSKEGQKIVAGTKATQQIINQSNATLAAELVAKQKIIDDLKSKYQQEMSKIK